MRNANTTPGTVTVPAGYTALGNTGAVAGATRVLLHRLRGPGDLPGVRRDRHPDRAPRRCRVPRSGWLTGVTVSGATPVITPGMFAGIAF